MRPGCDAVAWISCFCSFELGVLDRYTDGSSTSWWNSENAVSIPLPSLATFLPASLATFAAAISSLAAVTTPLRRASSCLIFAVSHVVLARRGEKIGGRPPSLFKNFSNGHHAKPNTHRAFPVSGNM